MDEPGQADCLGAAALAELDGGGLELNLDHLPVRLTLELSRVAKTAAAATRKRSLTPFFCGLNKLLGPRPEMAQELDGEGAI